MKDYKNNIIIRDRSKIVNALVLFLIFSLLVLSVLIGCGIVCYNRNFNSKTKAVSGYDLSKRAIESDSDANYMNNSSFIIKNKLGLKNFASSVNKGGVNFDGKSVYLESSLDFSQDEDNSFAGIGCNPDISIAEQRLFAGNFYGQNHTIRGFATRINLAPYKNIYEVEGGRYAGVGFFAGLSGKANITGLRIKDVTFTVPERWQWGNGTGLGIGGIAGIADGTYIKISRCAVEGLTINKYTGLSSSDGGLLPAEFAVGGIIGVSIRSSQITFCSVSELKCNVRDFYTDIYSALDGSPYFPGAFCGFDTGGPKNDTKCSIANSVFNESKSFCTTKNTKFKHAGYPNRDVASSVYMEKDLKYASLSSKSSNGGESESTWYICSGVNSGYPVLRCFIEEWRLISFKVASGQETYGSPPYNIINIPKGDDYEINKEMLKDYGAVSSIYIFDKECKASANRGYNIVEWKWDSSESTFTIIFEPVKIKVKFIKPNEGITYTTSNITINNTYEVYYGSELTVECTPYEHSQVSHDNVTATPSKSINYSITDINGNVRTITYYTSSSAYYLLSTYKTMSFTDIDSDYSLGSQICKFIKEYNIIIK